MSSMPNSIQESEPSAPTGTPGGGCVSKPVSMFVICPNCDCEMKRYENAALFNGRDDWEECEWQCCECKMWLTELMGQRQWEDRLRSDRAKLEAWKAMASV